MNTPPRQLRESLAEYRSGWSLPQPFYTDPEIFALDRKHIWGKYWLYAGVVSEIPKPGDYFIYALGPDSVVIIRGDKGEVYAHHNSCRHRGSLVCLEERGHATTLVCPYHQWVFQKNGSLHTARLMPKDFDKKSHGLKPVHVQVVEGVIFISLSDNPPAFDKVAEDYARFLKPFRFESSKVALRERFELNTNWKLITENFRECYHCGPVHPEYCRAVIGANLTEAVDPTLNERMPEWADRGLETRNVQFEGSSFHLAVRYPLRPGVESYSLDGKAVSIPMGDHKDHNAGVTGLCMYPNFWMDAVSDYAWTMRVTPVAATRCIVDVMWLVDGKAVEGVDYDPKRVAEFWQITGGQDWDLCVNNLKGVQTSGYVPGPYSPGEVDLVKFADWYIDRMREVVTAEVIA
ncbi:MAG: aromatic ring-hydroxylating dioxygenase subunit alpha [Opitutaceae bacterium]|nr:aromatic ring-hydroxylating dioxygenase subunit alpha [Opitutaceae bacterium]